MFSNCYLFAAILSLDDLELEEEEEGKPGEVAAAPRFVTGNKF